MKSPSLIGAVLARRSFIDQIRAKNNPTKRERLEKLKCVAEARKRREVLK